MDISKIKPYQKNAKKHPEKQIKQIAESIKAFGFNQPIVIDKNNEIIVGHGRYEAAKLLGLTDVPIIKADQLTEEQVKVKRMCKTCGKDFYIYKSSLKSSNTSGNFCKRICYNENLKLKKGEKNNNYASIDYKCDFCRKNITVPPAKFKDRKHHFCSLSCRSKFHIGKYAGSDNGMWKGGHIERKGNFSSVKSKYFKKDRYCAICGTEDKIHIHHIVPFRKTKDNSISNLIPLCVKHHRIVETLSWNILKITDDMRIFSEIMRNILRGRQQTTKYLICRCNNSTLC